MLTNHPDVSYTFTEPGEYGFHCLVHNEMKGTVTVVDLVKPRVSNVGLKALKRGVRVLQAVRGRDRDDLKVVAVS